MQVADRFHLLQNLAEVLERFFATRSQVQNFTNFGR
ncbi:hypothetical protein [Chroococcidiopsis sp. CCNUC1]